MGRMYVSNLEPRALSCESARTEGRQSSLMCDLRERVGLVHKLAQLARSEEFLDGGKYRLGVDQIMRHGLVELRYGHLFLDGPLHADEADPELVFEEFAYTPDTAVAEMVDVVHFSLACPQVQKISYNLDDILIGQDSDVQRCIETEFLVHLQSANRRKIIAFGIEEETAEEFFCSVFGGRLAGPQFFVNLLQCILLRTDLVSEERLSERRQITDVVDEKQIERRNL